MSQTYSISTIIPGSTSPATDIVKIKDAFDALLTTFSGTSAPSSPVAYQWWIDTTNGVLKQRNSANSAWIVRGNVADTRVVTKAANYTIVSGDHDKTILCNANSASFTLSITAAATLGEGFRVKVIKIDSSVNTVTLDPNSTETIDGATTKVLGTQYETYEIVCDGSNFYVENRRSLVPGIKGADIASASTLTLGTDGDYFNITGTTTITAISAKPAGVEITLNHQGAHQLTHNATSLELLSGANITTAAGDVSRWRSKDGTNWKMVAYHKADGTALVANTTTAATQSDQETATSTTTFVSPGRQQYHPSAAKAWVRFDVSGGTPSIVTSYNISSITDNGVGIFTLNISTAFSSANKIMGAGMAARTGIVVFGDNIGFATTAFPIETRSDANAPTDFVVNMVALFGDQ